MIKSIRTVETYNCSSLNFTGVGTVLNLSHMVLQAMHLGGGRIYLVVVFWTTVPYEEEDPIRILYLQAQPISLYIVIEYPWPGVFVLIKFLLV